MNGQGKLSSIALVVSITVIILMAIAFASLFFLYGRYKSRNVSNGHEDKEIKTTLIKRYKTIWEQPRPQVDNDSDQDTYMELESEVETVQTYSLVQKECPKEKPKKKTIESIYKNVLIEKEKHKKTNVILNVVFGLFYIVLIGILAAGLVFKFSGDQFFFGNTTYMTIKTGSMEKKNEENKYLTTEHLTNQIEQYSLIGIDKIDKEEDLKLYDVVAYKHEDIIIVHRIVRIYKNEDTGVTYYTTRGDSNSQSFTFEMTLTYKDLIGKYNGFQNYGLGVILMYAQSGVGLIALASCFVFLLCYNISEAKIEKSYEVQTLCVSREMDDEINPKKKKDKNE